MPLTVLQATSDTAQSAEDCAHTAPGQDARALLGQLHSALAVEAETGAPSTDSLPPVIERAAREAPSFGRAVARQVDQIQYLIEQISRLDDDTQLAELQGVVRDLCGALNDVVLRMKQNASDVTAKIGLLTGAVTIISGAADMNAPHDPAAILDGATAAAERMLSFERMQKDAGSAIVALEEIASSAQHAVRDLSAGLEKLSAHAESDRNEIASLRQRIELTDQSLAQGLARANGAIESDRNEIASLCQRIETTDQASADGLTALAERAAAMREEMARMYERLGAVESSTAQHTGFREKIEALSRRLEEAEHKSAAEINSWRAKASEQFATLTNRLEAQEQKNQVLSHDAEQMAARLQAAELAIATMTQSQKALSTWQDRLAQVLAGPQLPTA